MSSYSHILIEQTVRKLLRSFQGKKKAPDEAEKNILLTYCFVTQIMLILVTHCSVNVKTNFIIKEGYVCVLKTLNQKIRKFTGFQNFKCHCQYEFQCCMYIRKKEASTDTGITTCLRKATLVAFSKTLVKSFFPMTWDHFAWTSTSDILFQTPEEWFSVSISKHISFILQNPKDFWIGRKGEVSSLFWI